ncbi:MAG: hypothetical protein ACXWW0_13975, partial [Bacteroidia bacterium]
MKAFFKIFLTNWTNIVLIFIAVYLSAIISEIINNKEDAMDTFFIAVFEGLFAIIFYGSIFWVGFIISMFILDTIFFNRIFKLPLNWILAIECLLISSPFIYWFFEYETWIFLIGV